MKFSAPNKKALLWSKASTLFFILLIAFYNWPASPQKTDRTASSFHAPAPKEPHNTTIPNKEKQGTKVPLEWIEKTHKTASGDNWRTIEAKSIHHLLASKRSKQQTEISGSWIERGPSNIPGRMVDIEIDFTNNHIYSISDHGIVFQSDDLNGTTWTPLNDQFPLGLDVASQLEIFPEGRMVTSGWIKMDDFWGTYFTTNGGTTWEPSAGFSGNVIMANRRMLKSGNIVYQFTHEFVPDEGQDHYVVYTSEDQGASFSTLYQSAIPAGDGGRHRKSDMWVSNDPNHPNLYLMLEDSLFVVDKTTGTRTFNSLISNSPINLGLLTGLTTDGVTELRAYLADGDIGKFFTWNSIDQTWSYTGELTDWWLSLPFGPNSFSCSQLSANTLYFGGILTSKSTDGGASWTTMDMDETDSYALYHGDVPKTMTAFNPNTNQEEMYIGTDGGIYRLDNTEHFNSISIPGLNTTQIYKMLSSQSNPGEMFIGTQDNGYAHTNMGNIQTEEVDFILQYGGDVSNAGTGDGGETFWLWWLGDGCNYMTGPDQVQSTWSPYDFAGGIPYWEAPIWISNHFPDRCYTAGFINNNSGNYLIELQANQGAQATPTQFDYNFEAEVGAKISAIAISPIDSNYFYISTENGQFLSSIDGGSSWTTSLLSNSMYPKTILPSSVNLGEVWVGGSGYSNSPIFHTTDNGLSFAEFNIGMPPCMVEALATNEDESVLFAASSIGPFAYEEVENTWSDLSGTSAPLVRYMDVEFIPAINTARFASYARGVWDYQMETISIFAQGETPSNLSVFPNPAYSTLTIEVDEPFILSHFHVIDRAGKIVLTDVLKSRSQQFDVSTLPKGVYFIHIEHSSRLSGKFLKF